MASITPLFASLLSIVLVLVLGLGGCARSDGDYGFRILAIDLSTGYQKISAQYQQELSLSQEAIEALENGVPLTIEVEMELRDSETLMLLVDSSHRFEIRFLPLSERYQLSRPGKGEDGEAEIQWFPRLRHVMSELSSLDMDLNTGPLAPGRYEFRARISLDNARLPAPMHLPALFSSHWQHDSEWSTWPFEISA